MTNIDFTKSEQYILSIRLSVDGFSFSIHHPQKRDEQYYSSYEVNASYSLTANLKEMIASTEAFNHQYRQTNILVDTQRVTSIPFDLFEDEYTDTFFYHVFPPNKHETVLCNILGKSNIALLFGMDKYAHQLLNEHFPKANIYACISPIIEHFTKESSKSNTRKLYAYLQKEKMEVFAFDRGKLLLTNSFHCKLIADQVYYLLYIWQQLGFNQTKDHLELIGACEKEELLTELNKFLRHTHTLPFQQSLPFDLQTLMICE